MIGRNRQAQYQVIAIYYCYQYNQFLYFLFHHLAHMQKRYQACMLLAAVGDAIGYKRGKWEFNYNGLAIHKEMMQLTNQKGILYLAITTNHFPYSDDTVMHIATAKGLLQSQINDNLAKICQNVAKEYKACWSKMPGRGAGITCRRAVDKLLEDGSNWTVMKFQKNGGGCGASMRAACIGLYYVNDIKKLVQVSVETGRITHHNPLGYLGAVVSAYFTALAIKNVPTNQWLYHLFRQALPLTKQYVRNQREGQINISSGDWQKFQSCWKRYAATRKMTIDEPSKPVFPQPFGVLEREKFYKTMALNGWPGALGVDSVIIAYDALLGAVQSWEELCLRSMLHGGDNDSTGTIAGAWFGALYGFKGVPNEHLDQLEGRQEITFLGNQIFKTANLSVQL